MMEEDRIPALVCGFLNQIVTAEDPIEGFLPETWRDGWAALWMVGGPDVIRDYVDGSQVIGLTFDIRVRCIGRDVGDRLDVLGFYKKIADHVRKNKFPLEGHDCRIVVKTNASKSAVFDSGEEEYRASYVLRYFRKNDN